MQLFILMLLTQEEPRGTYEKNAGPATTGNKNANKNLTSLKTPKQTQVTTRGQKSHSIYYNILSQYLRADHEIEPEVEADQEIQPAPISFSPTIPTSLMMMAAPRADNKIQEVEADLHEIQPELEANEEIQFQPASIEFNYSYFFDDDDDGRTKRKGTFRTATAHIITAVIGSGGVLTLTWAMAQLGWIFGPIVMVLFAAVKFYTSVPPC